MMGLCISGSLDRCSLVKKNLKNCDSELEISKTLKILCLNIWFAGSLDCIFGSLVRRIRRIKF